MREACLLPVLLSLAASKSASYSYTSSTFPDIYSFHTGDWPFHVKIPSYPPPSDSFLKSEAANQAPETGSETAHDLMDTNDESTNIERPLQFQQTPSMVDEHISKYMIKEGRQVLDFSPPSKTKVVKWDDLHSEVFINDAEQKITEGSINLVGDDDQTTTDEQNSTFNELEQAIAVEPFLFREDIKKETLNEQENNLFFGQQQVHDNTINGWVVNDNKQIKNETKTNSWIIDEDYDYEEQNIAENNKEDELVWTVVKDTRDKETTESSLVVWSGENDNTEIAQIRTPKIYSPEDSSTVHDIALPPCLTGPCSSMEPFTFEDAKKPPFIKDAPNTAEEPSPDSLLIWIDDPDITWEEDDGWEESEGSGEGEGWEDGEVLQEEKSWEEVSRKPLPKGVLPEFQVKFRIPNTLSFTRKKRKKSHPKQFRKKLKPKKVKPQFHFFRRKPRRPSQKAWKHIKNDYHGPTKPRLPRQSIRLRRPSRPHGGHHVHSFQQRPQHLPLHRPSLPKPQARRPRGRRPPIGTPFDPFGTTDYIALPGPSHPQFAFPVTSDNPYLHEGANQVRFLRPIRQIQVSAKGIKFEMGNEIAKTRVSSRRKNKGKQSRFREMYSRKGPRFKKFRPPRHIHVRPLNNPKLHYKKYKEQLRSSSKLRNKTNNWRKPLNILERSRLRKLNGLVKKRLE